MVHPSLRVLKILEEALDSHTRKAGKRASEVRVLSVSSVTLATVTQDQFKIRTRVPRKHIQARPAQTPRAAFIQTRNPWVFFEPGRRHHFREFAAKLSLL